MASRCEVSGEREADRYVRYVSRSDGGCEDNE